MITILAEKPSVARELAKLLNASDKRDGYFEGNGYTVTWALGHLVGLALPQEYGVTSFVKESLPILPNPFVLKPRAGSGTKAGAPDKAILKQLSVVERLFKSCDSIIVATDAGREGELIFRYIYEYTASRKPFQRLWVSSLTEKALKAGFANLLPGTDFDRMYHAARARSRADWLIGINATQALTLASGGGLYSVGRVQTPTLSMICQRYQEHINFQKAVYWELRLDHTKSFVDFRSTSIAQWHDHDKAKESLKSVGKAATAEVISVEKNTVTEKAPFLFDLTGLQKMANSKFGLSASETLSIAQGLYEKQFITYPRTGSRHITPDLWTEIPGLIRNLQAVEGFRDILAKIKLGKLSKHIVDESKVTDHHGLLITEKMPSALSAKEAIVYRLIALRLLEAVSEPCTRETVLITLQALHYEFSFHSAKLVNPGWRAISNDYEEAGFEAGELPEFQVGEKIRITSASLEEKQTYPPKLYTEGTLLAAMENAGNGLEEKALKQALKGIGLGTPATRAGIIETLLQRNYIERKSKTLVPTVKGLGVYEAVSDKAIASVVLTAQWEAALEQIEEGSYSSDSFQDSIESYTHKITQELLAVRIGEDQPDLTCPKCNTCSLTISEKVISCPDKGCGWRQYRTICGVQLSITDITALIGEGQTNMISGMKSKSGKAFSARLSLNDDHSVRFSFK